MEGGIETDQSTFIGRPQYGSLIYWDPLNFEASLRNFLFTLKAVMNVKCHKPKDHRIYEQGDLLCPGRVKWKADLVIYEMIEVGSESVEEAPFCNRKAGWKVYIRRDSVL